MIRPNYAQIDLDALRHNIGALRAGRKEGVGYLSVVKANAYGHGIVEVARAAVAAGAAFLGVAIAEEGVQLREAGITAPILVLGGFLPEYAALPVKYDLCSTVYSCEMLRALQAQAAKLGKVCCVHIKADTGMNRIGVKSEQELLALLSCARECSNVRITGMFTHFAVSELPDKRFTLEQGSRFDAFAKILREAGFSPLLHASNSGATLSLPQLQYDMVRGGIAQYGYHPGPDCGLQTQLKPMLTWVTRLVHIKEIQPGETVSYGRRFTAQTPRRIATIPVGYGDGYKRILTNRAEVLIRGRRAKQIGTICMDQCMVDVTDIPEACLGDEVVLLGRQGNDCIDADEMAGWADTISYEILLSISDRVPRVYVGE